MMGRPQHGSGGALLPQQKAHWLPDPASGHGVGPRGAGGKTGETHRSHQPSTQVSISDARSLPLTYRCSWKVRSSPQPEHRPQHAETEAPDGPSLLLKVEASPLPQARPARHLAAPVRKASSLKMSWRPGFLQDSPVAGLSYSVLTARTTHGNTGGPGCLRVTLEEP